MNKQKAMVLGIIVLVAVAAYWLWPRQAKIDFSVLDQQITYYYGQDCPHCHRVLQFVESNQIEEKVPFTKKEVSYDRANGQEFVKVVEKCGLDPRGAGVPMVYADGKCLVGEPEVMSFFKQKAGISQ